MFRDAAGATLSAPIAPEILADLDLAFHRVGEGARQPPPPAPGTKDGMVCQAMEQPAFPPVYGRGLAPR